MEGGMDSLCARWSSREFISPVNDTNTYRTLRHRKILNVVRVSKVDFDLTDKSQGGFQKPTGKNSGITGQPLVQKLHNVPSGPNPIGNFDPRAQINGISAPARH